jgi:probable F420-dependent oxidoreductase
MRFTVEHPVGQHGCVAGLYTGEGLSRFAQAAEDAGFDALAFTEHPAPSAKWLDAGGHPSLDPLAALSFCAGVTHTIKLLTYLLVMPYRNPLLLAKSIATVDVMSQGRLIIGVGSGYLRSEFTALGVPFDKRGERLDESLDVLRALWNDATPLEMTGSTFEAHGVVSFPAPVQLPHPPLWIGGNGRNARRRVAGYGQGWAPLMIDEQMARTTRTAAISSLAELRAAITDMHSMAEEAGRDPKMLAIQLQSQHSDPPHWHAGSLEAHRDFLGRLAEIGVTSFLVRVPADSENAAEDALRAYGRDVIQAGR